MSEIREFIVDVPQTLPPILQHGIFNDMKQHIGVQKPHHKPILPKKWDRHHDSIAEPECSLYMAESSIPNSGLGIYAGKDFGIHESIDNAPQVVIPLIDMESDTYDGTVLSDYPWAGHTQNAHLEGRLSTVLYPHLGMLANSHLGLANAAQDYVATILPHRESYNCSTDFSAGAISSYHAATFAASKPIAVGTEIFVNYGDIQFLNQSDQSTG